MNYALKFPGRTRQKKYLFPFLIILILSPSINPLGVQASESSASSVASPDIVGSGSSEEENVDSFEVHPINRYAITNVGYSAVVSDGILNLTNTGDGSTDDYFLQRGLRDLDGTIEIRFKFDTTVTVQSVSDSPLWIELLGDGSTSNRYLWYLRGVEDNKHADQQIFISKTDGGNEVFDFVGDERVFEGHWYLLKFDYNLRESDIRTRLFFENGTKVFDYSADDFLENNENAEIFGHTSLDLKFGGTTKSSGKKFNTYLDYVKAPFKEREWTHFDDGGANFISEAPFGVRVEDNIDDTSEWRLTVPYFDGFSGSMLIVTSLSSGMVQGDNFWIYFTLYTVDADDGDLHEAVQIRYRYEEQVPPLTGAGYGRQLDLGEVAFLSQINAIADDTFESLTFQVTTSEDRSLIFASLQYAESAANSFSGSITVADVSDDPSQEFVISILYTADFDSNIEMQGTLTDVTLIERDIFSDLGGFVDDIIGVGQDVVGGGTDFFTAIFRWVVSVITDFLNFMVDVLLDGLTALGDLLDTVITTLGSVITELQGLAADVATAIWTGIEATLDFLFDAIDGIWTALIAILDDIIDALLSLVEDLWTILEGIVFFIWDAIGLPDALALGNELLVYTIELVDWLLVTFLDVVDFFNDLSWLILVIWWAWAIPIQWARAEFNPIGGVANFIEVYFYDALPWSIIGVHIYVPQGIIFTLWLLLLLPGDFALFTAMG